MKITLLAIDRSTTVFVLLGLIIVAGLYAYSTLPLESSPEVVIPIIVATTTYEGVAATDMESLVTIPIERKLTGISGVKEITSTSAEGVSSIQIEFEPDVDIDSALQKVRDKVDQAKGDLPQDADDTNVYEINISEFPIMFLSLTGEIPLPVLTRYAKDLEDELESIKGVLDVAVVGGVEREIQIIVDPDLAAAYGVSMADLVTLARVENINTPAGSADLGEAKHLVRVPGEFTSAADINTLVVKASPQGIVYLNSIAHVIDGFKEVSSVSRIDGRQAVTLTISKRSGENIIGIADRVRAVMAEAKKQLPPQVEIHITMDQSEDIRNMVSELENNIISGLILVLLVIFLFLGFKNAIFVALAIPVSMLITFIALSATDTTLNMVVLFSLILALGMLVDNGIVIVENIYRHLQMRKSPVQAAKDGAAEVAWPITASTLTTVAAFSPLFFWPGIWGKFMVYLPQTVCLALGGSLFVGLIVNPALAARVLRRPRVYKSTEQRHRSPIIRMYASVLRLALRWRMVTASLAVTLLLVITVVFFSSASIEFTPTTEPARAYVDIDCPEGTNLATTNGHVREVEERLKAYGDDIEFTIANAGSRGVSQFGGGGGGQTTHIGRVTMDFPKLEQSELMPSVIVEQVREQFRQFTGAELTVDQEQHGPSTGPPIQVVISGDDYAVLFDLAERIADIVRGIPNAVDVKTDYDKGKPEIRVDVDREQALLMGLNTQFVGLAVQAAIKGRLAGEFREGNEEYDVVVRFPRSFREDLTNLSSLTLINLNGNPVPFSAVAKLEQASGLGSVDRTDRKRTVRVTAESQMRSSAEVTEDIKTELARFPVPAGYSLSYAGEDEEMVENMRFLTQAFLVALLLIALVLVTQFNSIAQTFIIMSSVVLSLAGVFLGLHIFNMRFSVLMSGIGCISLAGVVVNNAIVLLDFINQLRARGIPTTEAIIEAGETRFRPVMLTAVTTILGLIPMAAGISYDFRNRVWIIGGETSQWWGPMAISVIFGLAFATLLTLIVVPTLYSLSVSLTEWGGKPDAEEARVESS